MTRVIAVLLIIGFISVGPGCSGSLGPGFSGVQGSVSVNSKPAPRGTRIKFRHCEDQSSFVAIVDESGSYSYQPPQEAPLKAGAYQVGVEPVTSTTAVDQTGLAVETAAVGVPKSYGKYSNPAQSGLEVTLSNSLVEFNIDISSK